jgi:hypothetical protein
VLQCFVFLVLQVLEIERFQQNREWEWIVPCIHSGAPLRKAVLFDNCNSNFVLWLFTSLEEILKVYCRFKYLVLGFLVLSKKQWVYGFICMNQVHKNHSENLRVFLGFMSSTIVGILNRLKSDLVSHPQKIKNRKFIALNILNKIFELLKNIRENEEFAEIRNNEEIYSMTYVLMSMLSVCCREIPGIAEVVGMGLKKIFKQICSVREHLLGDFELKNICD